MQTRHKRGTPATETVPAATATRPKVKAKRKAKAKATPKQQTTTSSSSSAASGDGDELGGFFAGLPMHAQMHLLRSRMEKESNLQRVANRAAPPSSSSLLSLSRSSSSPISFSFDPNDFPSPDGVTHVLDPSWFTLIDQAAKIIPPKSTGPLPRPGDDDDDDDDDGDKARQDREKSYEEALSRVLLLADRILPAARQAFYGNTNTSSSSTASSSSESYVLPRSSTREAQQAVASLLEYIDYHVGDIIERSIDEYGEIMQFHDNMLPSPFVRAAGALFTSSQMKGMFSFLVAHLGPRPDISQGMSSLQSHEAASKATVASRPITANPLVRFSSDYVPRFPSLTSTSSDKKDTRASSSSSSSRTDTGDERKSKGIPTPAATGAAAVASTTIDTSSSSNVSHRSSWAIDTGTCIIDTEGSVPWNSLHLDGNVVALSGASGWKQREPALGCMELKPLHVPNTSASSSSADTKFNDSGQHQILKDIWWKSCDTGFSEPGTAVVVDAASGRDLIWHAADQRIKAFSIHTRMERSCAYTLFAGHEGATTLAVNGNRLFAGGQNGTIQWWEIDKLTPHTKDRSFNDVDEEADDEKDSCRKQSVTLDLSDNMLEESDKVEITRGQAATHTFQIDRSRGPVQALQVLSDDRLAVGIAHSILIYDLTRSAVGQRLMGHTTTVASISVNNDLPNAIATASAGNAKIWDLRSGRCSITFASSQGIEKPMRACALASANGIPYVFTGGNDECVRVWDIRSSRYLYEMSTGNTDVIGLAWHSPSSSLIACVECDHIDRHGDLFDYDDEGEGDDQDDEHRWPSRAQHDPDDFGMRFDMGSHGIITYRFDPASPPQHPLKP